MKIKQIFLAMIAAAWCLMAFGDPAVVSGNASTPPVQASLNSSGNTQGILNAQGNPFYLAGAKPWRAVFLGDSLTAVANSVINANAISATSSIATLGTITGGASYTNGTYTNVPLVGNVTIAGGSTLGTSGTGALATIVVSGGAVTSVTITTAGSNYGINDSLTAAAANIGGTGSGFLVPVSTIGTTYSTLIKVTVNGHSLGPGQRCEINSAGSIEFNGIWTVTTVIDVNNFTVTLSSVATVAVPTGTVQVARGNTYGSTGIIAYLGQWNIKVMNNAGLGGDTIGAAVSPTVPGICTRLDKDVFPFNPDIVFLDGGINDVSNGGQTAAQIIANMTTCANTITNRNITLIVYSLPPVYNTGSSLSNTGSPYVQGGYSAYSAANAQKIAVVNAGYRDLAAVTPHMYYVDTYAGKVDPLSFNNDSLANKTEDGLHPSQQGGLSDANAFASVLTLLGVPKVTLVSSMMDTVSLTATSTNTISNPFFLGASGSTGTNVTASAIATVGTLVGGSSYTNGTYYNVPLTGGTGTGAIAKVTIASGAVTAVSLAPVGATLGGANAICSCSSGTGYVVGDVLSASASSIGGTGSGFTISVATVGIPTAWRVTSSGGGSQTVKITDPSRTVANDGDTLGNNIVATVTSAANNDSATIQSFVTYGSQFTNGAWLTATCDLGWSATTNLKSLYVYDQVVVGGVTYFAYWGSIVSTGNVPTDVSNFPPTFRGSIRIPPLYVPTGTITAWNLVATANFGGVGGAVVQLGRCRMDQYSTQPNY